MIENIIAKGGPSRCTYCSDDVDSEWFCQSCDATMHHDCYQEYGKCGSCNKAAIVERPREMPAGGWARAESQPRRAGHGWQPRRVNHPWYVRGWRALGEWWGNLWSSPRLSNSFSLNNRLNFYERQQRNKKIGIAVLFIALVGCIWGYIRAYENSAEAVTIIVADKWIETHTSTDDDGNTSTSYSYHIYTHGGKELTCSPEGWGWNKTRGMYRQLVVDHRYEVVIAGVLSKSDLVAINREVPLGGK